MNELLAFNAIFKLEHQHIKSFNDRTVVFFNMRNKKETDQKRIIFIEQRKRISRFNQEK